MKTCGYLRNDRHLPARFWWRSFHRGDDYDTLHGPFPTFEEAELHARNHGYAEEN